MLYVESEGGRTFRPLFFVYEQLLPSGTHPWLFDPLQGHWSQASVFLRGPITSSFEAMGYPSAASNITGISGYPPAPTNSIPLEQSPLLSAITYATRWIGNDDGENPVTHYNLRGDIGSATFVTDYGVFQSPQSIQLVPGHSHRLLVLSTAPSYRFFKAAKYDFANGLTTGATKQLVGPPIWGPDPGPIAHGARDFGKTLLDWETLPEAVWTSELQGITTTRVTMLSFMTERNDMVRQDWGGFLNIRYSHKVAVATVAGTTNGTVEIVYDTVVRVQLKKDFGLGYGPHLTMTASSGFITQELRPMYVCRVIIDRQVNSIAKSGDWANVSNLDEIIRAAECDDLTSEEFRPTLYWCDGPAESPQDVSTTLNTFYRGAGSALQELINVSPEALSSEDFKAARFLATVDAYNSLVNVLPTNFIESMNELREITSILPDLTHFILAYRYLRSKPWMAAKELAKAMAGGQLYYSFGLAPNAQVVSDSQRVLEMLADIPVTAVDGYGTHHSSQVIGYTMYDVVTRCKISMQDNYALHAGLSAILKLNAAGILPSASSFWDIVPMSFAADWVFHIGQKLQMVESTVFAAALPTRCYVYTHRINADAGLPTGYYARLEKPVASAFFRTARPTPVPPPAILPEDISAPPVIAGALLISLFA